MKTKALRRIGMGLLAGLVAAGLMAGEGNAPQSGAMKVFMRKKLMYSEGLLEGLTLEKFDMVAKNAIRLRDMTGSNHWTLVKQPDYRAYTTTYQKSLDALYMAAVDKKLEEATAAYMTVAQSCVDCHRLTRRDQR